MKTPNLTPQRLNWVEMTTTWKIEDILTLYISRYMCDAILFPVLWQGLWQKIIPNHHMGNCYHWLLKLQDVIKKKRYLSVLQTFSWAEATSTRMNPSGYSLLLSIWLVNIEMYASKTGHSLRSTHLVSEVSCKTRSLLYQYKFCSGSSLKVCFVKKRELKHEKFFTGN